MRAESLLTKSLSLEMEAFNSIAESRSVGENETSRGAGLGLSLGFILGLGFIVGGGALGSFPGSGEVGREAEGRGEVGRGEEGRGEVGRGEEVVVEGEVGGSVTAAVLVRRSLDKSSREETLRP